MSDYRKYMKHWKNHRKDRFIQQCGGPLHDAEDKRPECTVNLERQSFEYLMGSLKCDDFPIYVTQGSGGIWSFTNERNCFGTKIDSMEDMRRFFDECV